MNIDKIDNWRTRESSRRVSGVARHIFAIVVTMIGVGSIELLFNGNSFLSEGSAANEVLASTASLIFGGLLIASAWPSFDRGCAQRLVVWMTRHPIATALLSRSPEYTMKYLKGTRSRLVGAVLIAAGMTFVISALFGLPIST